MTVYSPDQIPAAVNADARAILTGRGLPATDATSFQPADTLRLFDRHPNYLVVGTWGMGDIQMCLSLLDGTVVCAAPWSEAIDVVNTSLRAFVACLDAIDAARPLSESNPRYGSYEVAAEQVRAKLTLIDPPALADPDSFWHTIADDIAVGDYDD